MNPIAGDCLTKRFSASNPGPFKKITLEACNDNLTTKVQFFQTMQTVYHAECNGPMEYASNGFSFHGASMRIISLRIRRVTELFDRIRGLRFLGPVGQAPARDSLVGVVLGV